MNPQFKNIVANFAKYCQKELNIERLNEINCVSLFSRMNCNYWFNW